MSRATPRERRGGQRCGSREDRFDEVVARLGLADAGLRLGDEVRRDRPGLRPVRRSGQSARYGQVHGRRDVVVVVGHGHRDDDQRCAPSCCSPFRRRPPHGTRANHQRGVDVRRQVRADRATRTLGPRRARVRGRRPRRSAGIVWGVCPGTTVIGVPGSIIGVVVVVGLVVVVRCFCVVVVMRSPRVVRVDAHPRAGREEVLAGVGLLVAPECQERHEPTDEHEGSHPRDDPLAAASATCPFGRGRGWRGRRRLVGCLRLARVRGTACRSPRRA